MSDNRSSIFPWWKKNFGRGVYAGLMIMMVGLVIQIGAITIAGISVALFPALDKPENSTLVNVIGFIGFVIVGIPLFGYLFTRIYEGEESEQQEPEDKHTSPSEFSH